MKRFGLTLLLMITGMLAAQNVPAIPEPAIVDGIVLKQGTAEPIPGVVVSFAPETGTAKTVTTGADGKFAIDKIPAGRYTVKVARTGFVRARRSSGPGTLSVTAGEHLKDIALRMEAAAAITGKVVDENGDPMNRVNVVPVRVHFENGRKVMAPCYSDGGARNAMTDEAGVYRIFGLQPGEYFVAAGNGVCVTQFYPDVADPADAVQMKVQAGAEVSGIDFHLKSRLFTAHFKLALISDTSPAGAIRMMQIIRRSRNGIEITVSMARRNDNHPDGETITTPCLAPGSYDIFYDNDIGMQVGHIAFDITDHDIDAGTMVIHPGTALAGQFRAVGALPAGWTFNKARVSLHPADGRDKSMIVTPGRFGNTSAEGKFLWAFPPTPNGDQVGALADGRYLVEVGGLLPDMYLASARYSGHDVLAQGLVIDGEAPGLLELSLDTGGAVEGVVRNTKDEPAPDSQVVLIPAQNRRSNVLLYKTAVTDQHGGFSIHGVAPGDYVVLAWEDVEPGAWLNADFLKDFENRATTLSVLGASTTSTMVRVIPASD